ncbi:MAG TPA: pitrilysin family protein [Bacteroidia bacterium]|nr:pitrilysin family protein [Bacteroidia bacterium]
MASIDRTFQPALNAVDNFKLTKANKIMLDNGMPMYVIDAGTNEVCKIELLINAGMDKPTNPILAQVACELADDGTSTKTAYDIAETVEFYGASLETNIEFHNASFCLTTLTRHLPNLLPLMSEIIYDATYPQTELDSYFQRSLQSLKVQQQKVEYLARKTFSKKMFSGFPYQHSNDEEDFLSLTQKGLTDFHTQNYVGTNYSLIACGKINDDVVKQLNSIFGVQKINAAKNEDKKYTYDNALENVFIEKENAVQSAIRIGKRAITRHHPDFPALSILVTVLGGYFGSRLMSNIREDKGYTYGIGAGLVAYPKAGSITISTEVGSDVCDAAIKEIYFEINRLCTEPIPEEELNTVRNYLSGVFLRSWDGPFALAERFKVLLTNNLVYSYYENYLNVLVNITSNDLLGIAQKYLNDADWLQVVCGSRK